MLGQMDSESKSQGFKMMEAIKQVPNKIKQICEDSLNEVRNLASKADINVQDTRFSKTCLHYAVEEGPSAVVKVLLEHGAKAHLKDGFGKTPLHYVAANGHIIKAKLLLNNNSTELLNMTDREGSTPLHCAAENDECEIITEFLKHDVNLNIQDSRGLTPLYCAVLSESWEAVDILIQAGAKVNITGSQFDKILPLSEEISKDPVKLKEILRKTQKELRNETLFEFDLHDNTIKRDCKLKPTEANKKEINYLKAKNNKYSTDEIDHQKIGKWMLFPSESIVDEIWDKIKKAVADGFLWNNLLCLNDISNPYPDRDNSFPDRDNSYPDRDKCFCAIMIFTKDYTDLADVISVLEFLETSGLKPIDSVIKYKTDNQTRGGIYAGGGEKAHIYRSDTIREGIQFIYDLTAKKTISTSTVRPTLVDYKRIDTLFASNNKFSRENLDPHKIGKWMLFPSENIVDDFWDRIKKAIENGDLWEAELHFNDRTVDFTPSTNERQRITFGVIFIFTRDYTDVNDVLDVLEFLEKSKLKTDDEVIAYRHSNSRIKSGNIYYSDTIGSRNRKPSKVTVNFPDHFNTILSSNDRSRGNTYSTERSCRADSDLNWRRRDT